MPSDVTMPDGTVITDVPDGTTKAQLHAKYGAHLAQQPQQEGGLLRNFAAGTVRAIPEFIDAIARSSAQSAYGEMGQQYRPEADTLPQPGEMPHRLYQRLDKIGLNPEAVPANTYAEKIARVAGAGAALLAVPEAWGSKAEGVLPKIGQAGTTVVRGGGGGIGSKVGQDVAEAVVPEKYKPLAGQVGSVIGGGVGGVTPELSELYSRGTNWATRPVVGALNKTKEWATGSGFTEPYAVATQRLAETIDPQRLSNNLADWRGAEPPTILDLLDNRGRRLVRSAVSGGADDAQNIAKTYAEKTAANLQGNTSKLAYGLTPAEPRSADIVRGELEETRGNLADQNYAGPYSQPATVTREMVSALQGPAGRRAINTAYATASDARNAQQMAELKDLQSVADEQSGGVDPLTGRRRSLEQALSEVSAGTLDRVRIAMRDRGIALNTGQNRQPARAAAHFARVEDIDTALDQTPGLAPARAEYRNYSDRIAGLDTGMKANTTPANDYAAQVAALANRSPEALGPIGVGHRQAIVNNIQSPKAGATGFLNNLGSATQDTENLGRSFGPETAATFQKGIRDEVQRVNNARFIDPGTGSETFSRLQDAGLIDKLPLGGKLDFLKWALDWVKRGGALTDAEREAIAHISMLPADRATIANLIGNRPLTNARPVIQPPRRP